MCGIAGIVKFRDTGLNLAEEVLKMSVCLRHRGPDDEGYLVINNDAPYPVSGEDTTADVSGSSILHKPALPLQGVQNARAIIAHRRLSIIDITPSGHQPLCDINKNCWIIHNGEIYNYRELRTELEALGYKFHTSSDTEVIIAAYLKWGYECVNHFNGMWAFVIYDKVKKILFASRDRFGVKPFYYYNDGATFAFASEQKALLSTSFIRFTPNNKAIFDYWFFSTTETEEEGMFKGIFELFPANSMFVDMNTGQVKKWVYYTLPFNTGYESPTYSPKATSDKIASLVKEAVNLRLRSDVEVGSCLSGGLDSSSIVSIASKSIEHPLHTFTASFDQLSIDESKWARIVATQVNAHTHIIMPESKDLVKDMHNLIYCQDIPIWSTSTYAQYRVMECAKQQGIKVVLDGQGGDELFAGYERYFFNELYDILKNEGMVEVIKVAKKMEGLYPTVRQYFKDLLERKYLPTLTLKTQLDIRRDMHGELKYLNDDFVNVHLEHIKQESQTPVSVNQALYNDFNNSILKSYLKCEDRCSMWHSVESRTPFSDDINLIEYVFNIPSKYKIKKGVLKSLLRDAMKGIVPAPIIERRDKKGYLTPNGKWIADIKEQVKWIYDSPLVGEYLDTNKIKAEYDQLFNRPAMPDNGRIFKLMAFPLWLNIFSGEAKAKM
jgi:asparagine synthase (glutamine-hydrolysing)